MDADAAFPPEDEAAPEMDAAPEDDMGDMGDVEMGDSVPVDKEDKFSDLVQQLADLVGIEVDLTTGDDTQDALVKEVARRVAKRISNSQKKDVMVDQIAERILKRLTK